MGALVAKGLTLLVLAGLAIGLAGCSGGDQGESAMTPEAQKAAKEQASQPTPPPDKMADPQANQGQVGGGTPLDPGESGR